MTTPTETSDGQLLALLRKHGALSIAQLGQASQVTATAVRQRLTRLMSQGYIERVTTRTGRGRPSHRYSLTEKARRESGNNFSDLALVLWDEIRSIQDPQIRQGLLKRLVQRLVEQYRDRITGETPEARMYSLRALFSERRVDVEVSSPEGLPQLTVVSCPYPDLAEHDRAICALEKMLFAELVQVPLQLAQCRLDGHECCQFQTSPNSAIVTGLATLSPVPA